MIRKPYTAEDDATLRRMSGTHTRREIATALGRTLRSVHSRAELLGLRVPAARPYSAEDDALIRELVILQPITVIAAQLGRSSSSVHARVQKLGLGPGTPHGERQYRAKLTALQAGMVQTLFKAGYTVSEMDQVLTLPLSGPSLYDVASGRNWKNAEVRG